MNKMRQKRTVELFRKLISLHLRWENEYKPCNSKGHRFCQTINFYHAYSMLNELPCQISLL